MNFCGGDGEQEAMKKKLERQHKDQKINNNIKKTEAEAEPNDIKKLAVSLKKILLSRGSSKPEKRGAGRRQLRELWRRQAGD